MSVQVGSKNGNIACCDGHTQQTSSNSLLWSLKYFGKAVFRPPPVFCSREQLPPSAASAPLSYATGDGTVIICDKLLESQYITCTLRHCVWYFW